MMRRVRFASGGILSVGGWILGLCCLALWNNTVLGVVLIVGSGLAGLALLLFWNRDPELAGEGIAALIAELLHKMN